MRGILEFNTKISSFESPESRLYVNETQYSPAVLYGPGVNVKPGNVNKYELNVCAGVRYTQFAIHKHN